MILPSDLMNSGKYKQIEKGSSGKIRKNAYRERE